MKEQFADKNFDNEIGFTLSSSEWYNDKIQIKCVLMQKED